MTNISPSDAAAALGSIKTERKAKSSAANLARGRALRPLKACTCGQPEGKHRSTCPVYLREKQRESRAKKV